MNIGLVVYSKTDHTLEVMNKLKSKLESNNHICTIERIILKDEKETDINKIEISGISELEYDFIIFGSPVHAFSLSLPMQKAISSILELKSENISFITKSLPFKWTGGNRTLKQMKNILERSGSKTLFSEMIVWSKDRDQVIDEFVVKVDEILNKK